MSEKIIEVASLDAIAGIFGAFDANVARIEKEFDVTVYTRDGVICVSGEEKKALTVDALIKKFSQTSGREFANDRALLS